MRSPLTSTSSGILLKSGSSSSACSFRLGGYRLIAESLGRVDSIFTTRLSDLLVALNLPVDVPELDHDELIASIQRDKKAEYGRLRFVLPTRLGHVELVGDIRVDQARMALSRG